MNPGSAVNLLFLSTQMLGIDPANLAVPVVPAVRPVAISIAAPQPEPRLIGRISLAEIREAQDRAFQSYQVGRGTVELSWGIGPNHEQWIKIRQGDVLKVYPASQLEKGVETVLPTGSYRITLENDSLHVASVDSDQGPRIDVHMQDLLKMIYDAASRAVLTEDVSYAVLYEDGRDIPRSIGLLRRDLEGQYAWKYVPVSELRVMRFLFSVIHDNTVTRYYMRLENGDGIVFYSKLISDAVVRNVSAVPNVPGTPFREKFFDADAGLASWLPLTGRLLP